MWFGSHHVSKYDRALEKVPFVRRLFNEDVKPYSILLITPSDCEKFKQVMFFSKFRNETFAIKDLDKIPEEVYDYRMKLKELFICFDAIIYYVPENMKNFDNY